MVDARPGRQKEIGPCWCVNFNEGKKKKKAFAIRMVITIDYTTLTNTSHCRPWYINHSKPPNHFIPIQNESESHPHLIPPDSLSTKYAAWSPIFIHVPYINYDKNILFLLPNDLIFSSGNSTFLRKWQLPFPIHYHWFSQYHFFSFNQIFKVFNLWRL